MTTKLLIDRELLERIDESAICDGTDATISDDLFTQLVAALDAPRQPERDGLEVVGWYTEDYLDDKSATTYSREVADRWLAKGWPVNGIANAADAQAIIDGLRGKVGAQRIKTCTALKERNDARTERDTLRQQLDEVKEQSETRWGGYVRESNLRRAIEQQRDLLAGLLRMVRQDGWYHPLEEHEIAQIDAALAEVNK